MEEWDENCNDGYLATDFLKDGRCSTIGGLRLGDAVTIIEVHTESFIEIWWLICKIFSFLYNHPVVIPQSYCNVHLLRSPWLDTHRCNFEVIFKIYITFLKLLKQTIRKHLQIWFDTTIHQCRILRISFLRALTENRGSFFIFCRVKFAPHDEAKTSLKIKLKLKEKREKKNPGSRLGFAF